jgi:hypothetical protein
MYQGLGIQVEAPEGEVSVEEADVSANPFGERAQGETGIDEASVHFDPSPLDG